MLKHLQIRNLAIIDELTLDFDSGFSVLTGETGAGKSILIDAIGLVIGTRADAALLRHGQEKAEISAEFSLDSSAASEWLEVQEMLDRDDPGLCVIRRVLFAEGRTRAFINGQPVNTGQLRELGERLIEIFGQSESQTLTRAAVQRELLDDYGGHAKTLDAVRGTAGQYTALSRQIELLSRAGEKDPAQLDYLRFQLQELDALNLQDGEIERLEADHKRLANAGRLLQEGGQAQERLYGGEASLYDQLAETTSLLQALTPLEPGFGDAVALAEGAQSQLREAADAVKQLLQRLDLDPEHLAQLERRMSAVHELARKHRVKAVELPARSAALRQDLLDMEQAAGKLGELEKQRAAVLKTYRTAAAALSAERQQAAKKFSRLVAENLRGLGMPGAKFDAVVAAAAAEEPRSWGDDEIRFDFSANPGQPSRPLAKVASGGELSRLSLAIQVAALARTGAPTMIFDEVDAGIGGGVAEIVGQTLRKLGAGRQVLSVTHLAQVAAQGHHHFAIHKEVKAGQTYTRVTQVTDKERVEELARMQGGVEITGAALSHARELLKRGAKS